MPDCEPRASRILVIDDEPLVRTALVRALRGHLVSADAAAEAALARMTAGERFDVVFCDITLGLGMSGIVFGERLRSEHPSQFERLVLLSGRLVANEREIALGCTVLQKPFASSALHRLVERFSGAPDEPRLARSCAPRPPPVKRASGDC